LYTPRADTPDEPLTTTLIQAYEPRGVIVYQRSDPRYLHRTSIPQPNEVRASLEAWGAKNGYLALSFAAYSFNAVKSVVVQLDGDLAAPGSATLSRDRVRVRWIRFWDQRTYWNASNYYTIPELLEDQAEVAAEMGVSAKSTAAFWIQVQVPADTLEGAYQGSLSLTLDTKKVDIPFAVRVLPFALEKPSDVDWIVQSGLQARRHPRGQTDANTYQYPTDLVRYVTEMKDYGVTGVETGVYWGATTMQEAAELARVIAQAQLSGPTVLNAHLDWRTCSILNDGGCPDGSNGAYTEALKSNSEFRRQFRSLTRELDETTRDAGIAEW